ncbi:hypothetical protein PPL_12400 [Heterostelium album PN500]|uniref:Uncharacterized protein n=1 Tax=Heterostelium pallidum (strain ATCC 26659 / Pp 5 / PN500) TaxID=670386 RepID=D3BMI0_HETP5|nr:hypothetical protein PPL_12400 [Heterostelium album PN500]EFA77192.1 hypothetical protein PPL_12400 [Heterostelium album PN500]|eukprot:XP_020429321.1 hypothetical protein PPL_12400 [Heterostelium album PN500]
MDRSFNFSKDDHDHVLRILGEDDGIRMTKLRMFFELLIENSINEFTIQRFEECFSDLDTKSIKSILVIIHRTVCQTLTDNINKEFLEICKERQIAAILSQIDQLIREQPLLDNGKRCPLFSLDDPSDLILTNVSQLKQNEYDRLNAIYQNLLEDNEKLSKQSNQLENEKSSTINNLNSKVKSVNDLIKASVQFEQ